MPEDGRGEGPVAEELLDWVNRADVGPTTEEGEEILASRKPWEHEEFWTYLIRFVVDPRERLEPNMAPPCRS